MNISTTRIGPSGSLLIQAEGVNDKVSITTGNFKYLSATALSGNGTGITGITAAVPSTISITNAYVGGTISGSSVISTTAGGLISGTYGWYRQISTTALSNTGLSSLAGVSATGNISANKFIGDGSLLASVTAAAVAWPNITSRPTVLDNISNSTGSVTVTTVSAATITANKLVGATASLTTTSGNPAITLNAIDNDDSGITFLGMAFCGNKVQIRTNAGDALIVNPCSNFLYKSNDTNGAFMPYDDNTRGLGRAGLRWNYGFFGTGGLFVSSAISTTVGVVFTSPTTPITCNAANKGMTFFNDTTKCMNFCNGTANQQIKSNSCS